MGNLRRKAIAVFFTLVFLASVVVLPGCKKSEPVKKETPKKQKALDME
ncbi:MAG: hypothetical protein JW955_03645 [Sedimentisphaerales bacterium]|nr:hypothetical protein [Sedimentisphaerales bacterium]